MTELLKENSWSEKNNSDGAANTLREVYTQDQSQKPAESQQFHNCSVEEANKYLKDGILPNCSIEGAINERVLNGKFDAIPSLLDALSARQTQEEKDRKAKYDDDPQQLMIDKMINDMEKSPSLSPFSQATSSKTA